MEQTAMRQKKAVGRLPLHTVEQPKTAESGQTLIEFALMLPFLMLLLLGIAEIGRAAFITITVNNAATAGAEYGSQNGATASDFAGMQKAALCDANGYTGSMQLTCNPTGILTQTPGAINYCECDTGGTTGISCSGGPQVLCSDIQATCSGATDQIVECVQVTTHADFDPLFHYPGLPTAYQANGKAIQRVRH